MVNLSAALGGTLLGIDHVGLAVRDLDEAIARWSHTFGLEVSHREINESQGIEEAMLDLADGTRLQLLAPLNSESTIAKFLERSGEGMQQLAFRVTNIDEAMANVLSAGMRLIPSLLPSIVQELTRQDHVLDGQQTLESTGLQTNFFY